jgi:predicted GNAT family N-acyltransferase
MDELTTREYAHGSSDYEAAVQLRRVVLRWPLGLEFTEEELAAEVDEILIGAFDSEGSLVGTLNLVKRGTEFKMRQVAVATDRQGRGIGSRLVATSELVAISRGGSEFVLHARESAAHFYERLGYSIVDEPFVEVGLPHVRMRKRLVG